ncbi:MAG: ATP-binding domain-containing protein [Verrucomicrobiae bacterium]|nr:ATP-binding domain-containing protein [Verrucomicrobiae bacterium]
MIGDVDQLPSVGPGNVLRDIIESGIGKTVRLTEIYRQDKASYIVLNAHLVNSGRMPDLAFSTAGDEGGGPLRDFYFIEQDDPSKVVETIIALVRERIPKRFGFDPVEDIQVLAPMHRGVCGVESLNRKLQDALNPVRAKFFDQTRNEQVERYGRVYRVRDKVMQIKNNYDKDVFNGDLGRVREINADDQTMMVTMDDRPVSYDFTDLDELLPAYAISIHKSQGCEYPAVVVPLLTQHYMMLQRNLLYTAITRARKLVVLVGSKKALAIAVRNNKTAARYSRLKHRLQATVDPRK